MRLFSFGISALIVALVGCAGSSSDSASSSAAETTTRDAGTTPPSMSVADAVAALESAAILPAGGNDDAYPASGKTPMDAIKAYIDGKYDSDPEDGDGFTFQANATAFDVDDQVAGTFTADVAIAETLAAIATTDATHDQDVVANRADEITGLLRSITEAGGSFGFDGFGLNGCSAPSAFLLVVDPTGKTVYGVDLNPCQE